MAMPVRQPKRVTLIQPDDWHLHLRNSLMLSGINGLSGTVGWSMAGRFRRALVMPNLPAPVVNADLAGLYRGAILAAADLFRRNNPGFQDVGFDPIMTLYLTDDTTPADIEAAAKTGFIRAAKLYPANATTNSSHGVTDIGKMGAVFEAMRDVGMKLCIHGEALQHAADGKEVDVFKRETVFLLEVLYELVDSYPGLEIMLEHITTQDAVTFVLDAPETVHATITAHHLVGDRNWLFRSADGKKAGLQPDHYCLPVFKKASDRDSLVLAATSGDPRFFLGTDSAPHSSDNKYKSCGCAGCFTATHALLICADVFEREGALDMLEAFVSVNGARAYGMPLNTERITLERTPFLVPEHLAFADAWSASSVDRAHTVVPFLAGMELPWSFSVTE